MARVFIDGEAGTTGLQIHARLRARDDIELVSLPDALRKDLDARAEAINGSDVTILCLPDAAAKESVSLLANPTTRFIDASTAHRIDDDWTYGFPEMTAGNTDAVARSRFVANPGCFPTGAIALLRPLREAGLLSADAPITINAVSGYSGGGKALIAEMEADDAPSFFYYGLDQAHKHLPEITKYSLLDSAPVFVPSVGRYHQGMIVQVPLSLSSVMPGTTAAQIEDALRAHYADADLISVHGLDGDARLNPEMHNDTTQMSLHVRGSAATGQIALFAVLDNLGKGASGAAVQNLDLMLGDGAALALAG
ncbi:MAG: N-acetyl-gamma-glutamyl-phosphate reductase [Pseudomonadota bacterium]